MKLSKIIVVCLIVVLIIAGAVFLIFKNKSDASTITASEINSNQTSKTSNDVSSDTGDINKVTFESAPILMYHYIREVTDKNDTLGANLSVTPENFKKQLDYLAANNYQTITLAQLRDGFGQNYKIEAGKKPIVITFDDGYDDAYTQAFSILKSHGMIGVFYIISGQIGQSERMTANQILQLDKAGMVIGSHTKNHLDVSTISATELNSQLLESKNTLETLLGHQVLDFCYPAGKYVADNIATLTTTGYLSATTTKAGIANTKSDIYELPRIRMQNSTNLEKVLK